ncbi:Glycosyl-hydrolase family 116 N-terminal [Trinorchestia longiramus]|nr:Glycosyl-hydrolase family 116 N-terminal [Trinorchestia longiramus]
MTNETEGPQENASPANTSQCASTTSLSSASGGSPGLPAGAQVADVTAAPSSNNRSAATEQPHTSNGRNFEQCTALANLDDYLPKYGFKVNFDYSFPKKWSPYAVPPVNMLVELVPFFFRYMKHFVSSAFKSKKPFIDGLRLITSKNMYGVPLGGIGCGTIGRGFRGEFCRFQVTPGTVDFNTAVADQFILTVRSEQGETLLQKVLSPVR